MEGQSLAVSHWRSVIGGQSLAVKYWRSVINSQSLVVGHWRSVVGSQILAVSHWRSVIGGQSMKRSIKNTRNIIFIVFIRQGKVVRLRTQPRSSGNNRWKNRS